MGVGSMKRKILLMVSIVVMAYHLSSCKSSQSTISKPVTVTQPVIHVVEEPVREKPKSKPEKQLYRNSLTLGIVMPFYLSDNFPEGVESDSVDIDARSMQALSFYEGALLAADSIKKTGIHIQLRIADNSTDTSAHQWMLMNYQWLKQNDLNFIHFASNQCDEIARSAEKFRLPVIISQCNNLSEALNEFTALITPSTRTQCTEAMKFVIDEFPMHTVAVMARQTGRENDLADIFLNALNRLSPGKAVRISPSDTASWKQRISASTSETVMVLASSDEYFVTAILNSLDMTGRKITVIGMPTWENFETIRLGSFNKLDVICFNASWLEFTDEEVKSFRDRYLSQYKTDINWHSWQGMQTVIFASHAAYTEKVKDIFPQLFPLVATGGFENQSVSIIRYSGFEAIRLKRTKP